MNITDQTAAQRLAMCNDIGEAAYVDSLIAAALFSMLHSLPGFEAVMPRLEERYNVPTQASRGFILCHCCCTWTSVVLRMWLRHVYLRSEMSPVGCRPLLQQ